MGLLKEEASQESASAENQEVCTTAIKKVFHIKKIIKFNTQTFNIRLH